MALSKNLMKLLLLFVWCHLQTHSELFSNESDAVQGTKEMNKDENITHVKSYSIEYIEDVKPNIIQMYESPNANSTPAYLREERIYAKSNRDTNLDSPYTIEVLVVVDKKMRQFHSSIGSDLKQYVLSLMSTAANVFADPSVGNFINIAVIGIVSLNKDLGVRNIHKGKNANMMLRNFKDFMNNMYKNRKYDVGLLLTREDICTENDVNCYTVGLAGVGAQCTLASYTIVEDTGLDAGYTIAHEFGHLLSAIHDDEQPCAKYLINKQKHVMSASTNPTDKVWSWSPCSRHYITEFLEDEKGSCLLNKPSSNMLKSYTPSVPNPNRQCQLKYGITSRAHLGQNRQISCNQKRCELGNLIWTGGSYAEGTKCAPGKLCHHVQCVQINKIRRINGGWSGWKKTGHCTRNCNGGVQWYSRDCNNPAPKEGRYCIGRHKIYKICNTQNCGPGTMDIREQQCISVNRQMTAAYNVYPNDQCKLACRNKQTNQFTWVRDKVIDGTPCTQDSSDKCISGICRPAGCDNKLYSNSKVNRCGVCSSNENVCNHYAQTYSAKQIIKLNKYKRHPNTFYVAKIPKGATNIEIVQFGRSGDGNYIVFGHDRGNDARFGKPFTNTNKVTYPYDGLDFEYTSNSGMVKMNTKQLKHLQRDLILKIFLNSIPNGNLIRYSYWTKK